MGNIEIRGRNFVIEPCSKFKGCHIWKVKTLNKNFQRNLLNLKKLYVDKEQDITKFQETDDEKPNIEDMLFLLSILFFLYND